MNGVNKEVNKMIIYRTKIKDLVPLVQDFYANEREGIILADSEKVYALGSVRKEIDEQYCIANDIEFAYTNHSGGTVVGFPESVNYAHFSWVNNNHGIEVMQKIIGLLEERGVNAEFVGNDVLAEGKYKVASTSKLVGKGLCYTGVLITIECDVDLISNICTKPMVKIPKGLSDYGITREEVEKLVFGRILT